MPNCCCRSIPSTDGTNAFFSKKAETFLKRFRKKGLAKEQRLLERGVLQGNITGKSILEIGCGVGGLHISLLKGGGASAVGIDLSEGMIDGAKRLSKEMGMESRTSYLLGDFASLHSEVPASDVTVLDKVVCCYEEIDLLLDLSLAKTRDIYALTFPRPNKFTQTLITAAIGVLKLFKAPFHPYWHNWQAMMTKIAEAGFRESYRDNTMMWQAVVFTRIK